MIKNDQFPTILGGGVSYVIRKSFQTDRATSIVACAKPTV